jgi:Protein of unknown function (DUF732)
MFRRRLITLTASSAVVAAAFGGALVFSPATAVAAPQDDTFAKVVAALDIPVESPEQAARLGNNICTMLTQGGAAGPNPVPTVRGVVNALTNQGLEKAQAVPLMRAAVAIYCPQYGGIIGR